MEIDEILKEVMLSLSHFLTKGGEKITGSMGEDLWKVIKKRFSKKEEAQLVGDIENNPKDVNMLQELKDILSKKIEEDSNYYEEIRTILRDKISSDNSISQSNQFGDNIAGDKNNYSYRNEIYGLGYKDVKDISNEVYTQNYQESINEIKILSDQLLEDGFYKLRKEALLIAERNINIFIKKLDERFSKNQELLSPESLRNPDNQASINEAFHASGRKGESIDLDILAELVVNKFDSGNNQFHSLVCEEAIRVLPRLSRKQISLLAFSYLTSSVKLDVNSLEDLESVYKDLYKLTSSCFGVSELSKKHIEFVGAASIVPLLNLDIYTLFIENYDFLRQLNIEEFQLRLLDYSYLDMCLKEYNDNKLFKLSLTTVGEVIAIAHLESIYEINIENYFKE